jgi:hypothetical protein
MTANIDSFWVEVVYPALKDVETYYRSNGYNDIGCMPRHFTLHTPEGIRLDLRIEQVEGTPFINLIYAAKSPSPIAYDLGWYDKITRESLVERIKSLKFEK